MGPIPLRRAVEQSRNIPAVKTLQAVGVEKGIEYARRLGLAGELPPYLPIALGAGEATLLEMVGAYATFANQGLRMKPVLIERITDRDGNVIEQATPRASDALRADTAFVLTSLLRGVAERGTAARARRLGRPIAGKTGTTNDFTDAWFIGYEPSLAAGVWVGFDEKKDSLGPGADGGRRGAAHLDGVLGRGHRRPARRGVPHPGQRGVRAGGRDGAAGPARGAGRPHGDLRGRHRAARSGARPGGLTVAGGSRGSGRRPGRTSRARLARRRAAGGRRRTRR